MQQREQTMQCHAIVLGINRHIFIVYMHGHDSNQQPPTYIEREKNERYYTQGTLLYSSTL